MLSTCWGVRQLDAERNIAYVQNVKARDFEACAPFQLIGRPYIDEEGDFRLHKRPGECGYLQELDLGQNRGGAPVESMQERSRRMAMVKMWLSEDGSQTSEDLVQRFKEVGIKVTGSTVRRYKMDLG